MNPKFNPKILALYRNRGVRQKIANLLLDGPDWLVPLTRVDDFGWLEPALKIDVRPLGVNKTSTSYAVFVDDTINRHARFLRPVVRRAYWDRPQDYQAKRKRNWPRVDILHHTMSRSEQRHMHLLLQRLDRSFNRLEFLTAGLVADRTDPPGCTPKGALPPKRYLCVKRSNACQYIEFALDHYAGKNKPIERAARALIEYCDRLCERPDPVPYRERYPVDLRDRNLGKTEWFFRPKRLTE